MPKEKALQSFRKPPLRLNCAQSIAHAFGRDDLVEEMKANGGGNAPDGLCGALFCAMRIAGTEKERGVAEAFEKRLGRTRCRALKGEVRVPCEECVAGAAEILDGALRAR